MWSDGFNGAPPFLAAMGFYDEALKQIDGFRRRLWNPEKKMLAHIWDEGKGQLKDAQLLGRRQWLGGRGTGAGDSQPACRAPRGPRAAGRLCARDRGWVPGAPANRWSVSRRGGRSEHVCRDGSGADAGLCDIRRSCSGMAAGRIIAPRRTGCAPQLGPRWMDSALCRAPCARRILTGREPRPRRRHSAS